MPPLTFTPLLKVRVWGGSALKSRTTTPPADPVGESWEVADHGEDTSIVASGPLAGMSLHQIFTENREALCGRAVDPANPDAFPLLLKLIDPCQDLSVQVHPDDAYAGAQKPGELGKTEAWYVLQSDPGSRIYRGLKPGVTREQFADALANSSVANLLDSFEARAGDVVFIPSGTIHALGRGVRIAEIQQNSDTTFRVFDWNRVGLDGRPRELHIRDALAVSDFTASGQHTCEPEIIEHPGCVHERFVACDKFNLERMSRFRGRPVRMDTERKTFHIITVLQGKVTITTADGRISCGKWDTVLVPAVTGEYSLSPDKDASVLLFFRDDKQSC